MKYRSKLGKAYFCYAIAIVLAFVIFAAGFFGVPHGIVFGSSQDAPIPPRSQWLADQRLTFDPAASQLSFNFAWCIAADAAGRIHVAWFDERDGNSQVYYKRSPNGGQTWEADVRLSQNTGVAAQPAIAASGNSVYVVWHESRYGGSDIYFKSSADGGLTWSGEAQLTSDGASSYASIAAQGDRVHIVWDSYQNSAQSEVYTSHSTDAGLTWTQATRLSDLPHDSWLPTIAVSGQQVYAAWVDTRDNNEEEYFRSSRDGGLTWGPLMRLTNDRANSWAPSLVASGDAVHLVWFDQQDSHTHPLDAEEKLDEAMRLMALPVSPLPAGVVVVHPEVAAERRTQEKLVLIHTEALDWIGRGGDVLKLQAVLNAFEALGQQGAGYLERERKLDEAVRLMELSYIPSPQENLPKIYYVEAMQIRAQDKLKQIRAVAPDWVHHGGDLQQLQSLIREYERLWNLASTEWDVYYLRSLDGGQTWEPAKRLTDAPLASARPSLALAGNDLHAVWYDLRDGNAEIYYKHSFDAGASWTPDERLTTAPGDSVQPAISVTGNAVHVIWADSRDGNSEIYYKRTRQRASPKR
jgi:hypothetical protein